MQIMIGRHTVEIHQWQSADQMKRELSAYSAGYHLFGEDIEAASEFYTVSFHIMAEEHRFGIGVCVGRHGITPQVLLLPDQDLMMLGVQQEVVGISLTEGTIRFHLSVPTLFRCFVALTERNLILVFDEIGVMALIPDGQILWEYYKDIITNYQLAGESLFVEFMDSPPVVIHTLDGQLQSIESDE
ncbi:MAG: hypothetical protein KatS3mg054_1066 [Chloroflexus sp.]|nr:MAG: hypothetical protein KatS3mg054_1066 [Chloroflexus sp.]